MVVAATVAAAHDGENGRGAMAVAVEQELSGTERPHKDNGSGNVGTEAASMALKVEGNIDDSLNKNSVK